MLLRLPAAVLSLLVLCACAQSRPGRGETFDTSAGNLIVVLRESAGGNKQDESLRPLERVRVTLDDGREMALAASWFDYLGDMQLRLVFDGGQSLQSASPEDLARLQLSPEQALRIAVTNLRRVYGAPQVQPWSGGLMQVQGRSDDLNSSYFLDRDFWQALQNEHPEGLVVAVPRRGGLVYAPLSDALAVDGLRFSVAALYASARRARLSSALYLFRDGQWSVFQPPQQH